MPRYEVSVVPNSSQEKVERLSDTELKVWLKVAPVDGKANERLIIVLAKFFGVNKKCVQLISGKVSKKKIIELLSEKS